MFGMLNVILNGPTNCAIMNVIGCRVYIVPIVLVMLLTGGEPEKTAA